MKEQQQQEQQQQEQEQPVDPSRYPPITPRIIEALAGLNSQQLRELTKLIPSNVIFMISQGHAKQLIKSDFDTLSQAFGDISTDKKGG